MKTLQTIQKTFRVFQNLTKIAMILSFVWVLHFSECSAALCGTAAAPLWASGRRSCIP